MRVKIGDSYLIGNPLDLTSRMWHVDKKPKEQRFFVFLEPGQVFGTETTANRPKE